MQEIYGQFVGEGSYRPSEMGRRYVGEDPNQYPAIIMTTNHGQGDEFFYADSQDAYDRWRNGQRAYAEPRQEAPREVILPREPTQEQRERMERAAASRVGVTAERPFGYLLSDGQAPPPRMEYAPESYQRPPYESPGNPDPYRERSRRAEPAYTIPLTIPDYQPQSMRRELWDMPMAQSSGWGYTPRPPRREWWMG